MLLFFLYISQFIVSKYTHPKDEESYMYYYEVEDPEADNAEKKKRKIFVNRW